MSQRMLFTALLLSALFFNRLLSNSIHQNPESQRVLIGSNATFSCGISDDSAHSHVEWEEILPNESKSLNQDEQAGIYIYSWREEGLRNSMLTIVINPSNAQRWNGAILRCFAPTGGRSILSESANLTICIPLRPLTVSVTPINRSTLNLSWTPRVSWPDCRIDSFNVFITKINTSQTVYVLENLTGDSVEVSRFNFTDSDHLQPCTEFNFSISAVSATNGESDPRYITGGFDEVPDEFSIISLVVYFHANGSPLVDLEMQLPTNVCSYQDIIYSIEIREGWPSELNQNLTFRHQGSGNVQHRIMSGLNRNKNYSLIVTVKSVVGESEESTNFDTYPRFWISEDLSKCNNIMTNTVDTSNFDCSLCSSITTPFLTEASSEDAVTVSDRGTLILYIILLSVLLAVVVLVLIIIVAVVFACICITIGKRKYGCQNTQRRVMVNNPIYNQEPVPLYDTIPTALSENLNGSETNGASNISGFKTSSSTFKAANAYVDEPHNSLSCEKKNFLGVITIPNVIDAENEEETYAQMLPGGTVADSKL